MIGIFYSGLDWRDLWILGLNCGVERRVIRRPKHLSIREGQVNVVSAGRAHDAPPILISNRGEYCILFEAGKTI